MSSAQAPAISGTRATEDQPHVSQTTSSRHAVGSVDGLQWEWERSQDAIFVCLFILFVLCVLLRPSWVQQVRLASLVVAVVQPAWSTSCLTPMQLSKPSALFLSLLLPLHLPLLASPRRPQSPSSQPCSAGVLVLVVRLPKQRRRQDRRRRQGPRALANPFGAAANVPQIS